MKKQPFKIKVFDKAEASQLQQSLDVLYKYKPERIKFTDSAAHLKPFQEVESGKYTLIGTGSAIMQFNVPFQDKYSEVFNIKLQSIGVSFTTNIVNYTASSLLVEIGATASLGSESYSFFWEVVGSLE